MARTPRWLLWSIVAVAVVALVAGGVWYTRTRGPAGAPAAPTSNPEQDAAARGRTNPTAPAGAPTVVLGGGQGANAPWYELYFTQPIYPDPKTNRGTGLDVKLVELINAAKTTIDAADYDFDLENVATALAAAKKRGVRVRFVTDTDTWTNKDAAIQKAWGILRSADIPIVDDQRGPIMHNKFMVVDGEWVWTGSVNWTDGDVYHLANHAMKIRSKELAENYTAEFEKMFVGRKFGPSKPKGVPHPRLTIGGATVENVFTSEEKVAPRIIERINAAQRSIQFLAFSFTHDEMGKAMIAKHRAGVKVRGVFETTGSQTQFSEFGAMKQAGMDVYTDGSPWIMHHKVVIIDERTVLLGSWNFSSNADNDNDENALIIDDPQLAQAFLGEVDRMVQLAQRPIGKK